MTKEEHHLLCLGVLAALYHKARNRYAQTDLDGQDMAAVEDAVRCAEALGLPVSLDKLKRGEPISTAKDS